MPTSSSGGDRDKPLAGVVVLAGDDGAARGGDEGRTPRRRGLWRLARRLTGLGRRAATTGIAAAAPVLGPMVAPVARPLAERVGLASLQRLGAPALGPAARRAVAVRHDGRDLALGAESIAAAFPQATDRILVLVPGAGEDERVWHTAVEQTGASYGDRLAHLLGWTPVALRHDLGADPAGSGLELSALLQQLVDGWPVEPDRIVLLGHGAGGLVARSACAVRAVGRIPWTDLLTEVVALGTPYLAVSRQPLSRGVGRAIDEALAGIVVAGPELVDVPPFPGVDYVLITDRVQSRGNPIGRALGELLWWRHRQPLGRREVHDLFPTAERFEVATTRQPLVNHTDVHDALLRWLT